ncbi:MAG TPA: AtpZ/AtpI family protein [Pyrinomonadaceae bacterium]|jgi:F0F1-type ATP synthase assembly protein I|nr:AtpZ/AtpI family protein [Pyrinomonadaceae bacterium]
MIEKPSEYLEDKESEESDAPIEVLPYTPESAGETARKSGLAYSAGIVLFGSVAIMFFIGLLLDRYLGTSPGFLVGGIILGAILGFYQFFRITSRIIGK